MLDALRQFPYLGMLEKGLKTYNKMVLELDGIKPVNSNKKSVKNELKLS